jgi:superfamily I DNA/RNA helicase
LAAAFSDPAGARALGELDVDWWQHHLLEPRRRAMRYPVAVWRRRPAALREDPRVIVGTIHSVKGGEADTVMVLPDLSGAAYFGPPDRTGTGWDAGGAHRHPALRLFYVAFTRARERLVLCAPSSSLEVRFPRP